MGSTQTTSNPRGNRADRWTITQDGRDSIGKPIFMVRLDGKPYSRAFSMSEARHLVRRYEK